jgi:beta-N-acetylhexosaminidase
MRPIPGLLTRRQFLALGGSTASALLAACATHDMLSPTQSSTPTPSVSAVAVPSASPSPTGEPRPDLRARIAQMLMVGFRGTDAATAATALADIEQLGLGGVVLFGVDQSSGASVRNIVSPAQLGALTGALQEAAGRSGIGVPLLVAVDEEGGHVARLNPDRGFPSPESAASLGALDDDGHTRAAGAAVGQTLREAGINLNLAPVVDLNLNPDNPVIGALDRSFSPDPEVVSRQAAAFIEGSHDAGTLTTLKHFPGHGSSIGDTHLGVADVTDNWQEVELDPYRSLVAGGLADTVLTAHVFNARLDAEHPATLSRPTITGILREQIGFDGVVLSDDMQMGAIRDAYGYPEAVALAIEAGVDILTIANQIVFEEGIVARTVDIIEGHVASGRLDEARIDQSWRRIRALKGRML